MMMFDIRLTRSSGKTGKLLKAKRRSDLFLKPVCPCNPCQNSKSLKLLTRNITDKGLYDNYTVCTHRQNSNYYCLKFHQNDLSRREWLMKGTTNVKNIYNGLK